MAKVILITNWAEVGDGFYRVKMLAADLSALGIFRFKITSATIDEAETWVMVRAAALAEDAYSLDTCDITGRFVDPNGGGPLADALIHCLPLAASAHMGALVAKTSGSTKSRADGTFTITLPRGLYVAIDCPDANYSRRLTVPNQQEADLLGIP